MDDLIYKDQLTKYQLDLMHMRFDKIVLIGSGKIACDCVNCFLQLGVYPIVIESLSSSISMLSKISSKNALPYILAVDKQNIANALDHFVENSANALVVSANNEYLFPQQFVSRPNVEIINFHYGYLPDYRGMNIPTWVIFNGESFTGVTWHYVDAKVDNGTIIAQGKIQLIGNETALDIVRETMKLGIDLFESFIADFLQKPIAGKANRMTGGHCYTRKQLPLGGVLSETLDAETMIRALRAYDYAPMQYIPPLKTQDGKAIQAYRVWKRDDDELKLVLGKRTWKSNVSIEKKMYLIELLV